MEPLWAHSVNVEGRRHALADHLHGTATLAHQFGSEIGAGDFAYAAGLLHDIGKLVGPWQQYLDASERGIRADRVDHKTSGAALFTRIADMPGWLICQGHHGGIPDRAKPSLEDLQVDNAITSVAHHLLPELGDLLARGNVIPAEWLEWNRSDPLAYEMAIRLVHSTLVDADFLDTAAHFNATQPQIRTDADFAFLNEQFTHRLHAMLAGRTPSPVDSIRAALLDECLDVAESPRGVFRLPAPTGSGKTISAAAFALAHAARHGMRRVIVAVPFLSITEQNAAVYRSLVGDDHMIEHHSGLSAAPAARTKYGVENWDAPFVITTTVQLFESLFSNKPSRTRKLHRLANAVIILDEIQAIPRHVLPVILDGLRILHERFGATVVLSSATQPAWDMLDPWRNGGFTVRDIVADTSRLYAGLRRSTVEWRDVPTLDEVADAVAAEPQAMFVVNTVANARELALLVRDRNPEGVFHLSTRMYPAHRRRVLQEVRERLDAGLPVRLVTTQLVEAGVDLDFPVVFRAMAPAENLSQARGRCNREGRLPSGRFVVVSCPELWELEKVYASGIAMTRRHFVETPHDVDDPAVMSTYYADLFRTLDLDRQPVTQKIQGMRREWRFASVAEKFRMIDDDSVPVVVGLAAEAAVIIDELIEDMKRRGAPSPDRFRRLQDFTVNLHHHVMQELGTSVREEIPGVSVWRGPYDDLTGVTIKTRIPQDSVW